MSDVPPDPLTVGSLQPPPRWPPTAVGAATPEPEPRPPRASRPSSAPLRRLLRWAQPVLEPAFAAADALAGQIRRALHLPAE